VVRLVGEPVGSPLSSLSLVTVRPRFRTNDAEKTARKPKAFLSRLTFTSKKAPSSTLPAISSSPTATLPLKWSGIGDSTGRTYATTGPSPTWRDQTDKMQIEINGGAIGFNITGMGSKPGEAPQGIGSVSIIGEFQLRKRWVLYARYLLTAWKRYNLQRSPSRHPNHQPENPAAKHRRRRRHV